MNPDDEALAQRRGCNCKKSGCLKLYCECFAAGRRCFDRCQCLSCKNHEHNQKEIAEAIRTIEKRTQKSFRPSVPPRPYRSEITAPPPLPIPLTSSETPATFPNERKAAMAMADTSPRPVCVCTDGNCTSACPCLSLFGTCSPQCQCGGCQIQAKPERTKGCSCKKSNCLKLYCECLAAQGICDDRCNCVGCKNRPETLVERGRAVAAILERNPLAFQPKVASGSSQHLRGCNCRKSGCMKNYCECHQAGVACTSRCACHQCRNTETFVSAKKMLVFAGVSSEDNSLRFTIPSQRKIAKRPSRGKKSESQNGMLTPTNQSTQRPSALELLSRSAPVAPTRRYGREDSAMDGIPPSTPTKRPSSHMEHYHTTGGDVAPTFAKRKYTRRSSNRLPFEQRIQEAVGLPSVADTVTNVYDARNTEGIGDPELTLLSRSLLHTAMTVELAEEKVEVTAKQQAEKSQDEDHRDGREALSPTAAGLFCEEEYSEAVADDDSHSQSNGNETEANPTTADQETNSSRQENDKTSLSAMQERAVLQEFSAWLRNLVSGGSSTVPNE